MNVGVILLSYRGWRLLFLPVLLFPLSLLLLNTTSTPSTTSTIHHHNHLTLSHSTLLCILYFYTLHSILHFCIYTSTHLPCLPCLLPVLSAHPPRSILRIPLALTMALLSTVTTHHVFRQDVVTVPTGILPLTHHHNKCHRLSTL